jgi:hypothetical protein
MNPHRVPLTFVASMPGQGSVKNLAMTSPGSQGVLSKPGAAFAGTSGKPSTAVMAMKRPSP